MGRWNYSSRDEADFLKKLEVWWLLRDMNGRTSSNSTISWGQEGNKSSIGCEINLWSEEPFVRLYYMQTNNFSGEKKDFDYKIPLTTTPCNFGGERYWFKCPLSRNGIYCGRRVGVLYKGGDYYACRHCYDLTYSSRKEDRSYKHYPLFKTIELSMKAEKLAGRIKRTYYAGKPTKKYARLLKLYEQAGQTYRSYDGNSQ